MTHEASSSHAYFRLEYDDTNPDSMIAKEWDLQGVNQWLVFHEDRISDWPPNVTFRVYGQIADHQLLNALNGWVLVSDRVRQALQACGIGAAQFLPVHVHHLENLQLAEPYWLLHVSRHIEALDWVRSIWLHPEAKDTDPHPILNILRVVLRDAEVAGLDIFRLKVNSDVGGIYVSVRFVKCLEHAGLLSGFKFLPVETV